jgi:carbon monoxide dehydrogenase subunit G
VRVEKSFEVSRSRDEVVERLCSDETLLELLPGKSEIVESEGDHRTVRTHYQALGREGVATFDFIFLMDGNIRFQKRCDGRIWRELSGEVAIEERRNGAQLRIQMSGRTKSLIPEFTIKQPMEEQVEQMASALRELLGPEAD